MEPSIQDKARAQYAKQAHLYSTSATHATNDSLQLLLEWAAPDGSERALDVATGTGFCAMEFAPHVKEVVAYDLTPEMLAEAERLAHGRGLSNMVFREGPAENMPFHEGEFDIVTCRVACHHFASAPAFLQEAHRVLKPGGKLLIVDTAAPDDAEQDRWQHMVESLRDPSHVRNYNTREWLAFLTDAGFVDAQIREARWTRLTFNDWVRRSGTPEATVSRLRDLFRFASQATVQTFRIEQAPGDDFAWEWPVVCLLGKK